MPILAINTRKTALTLLDSYSCHQILIAVIVVITFAGYPFVVTYYLLEEALVFCFSERRK